MKYQRNRVVQVFIFCTLLATYWLALLPGSTTVFARPAGRPAGLAHSQIVDPPTFKQDRKNGCGSSKDFDMTLNNTVLYNGKAHYRKLTINSGGSKCDHLSWDSYKTVPQAAVNTCRFFMRFFPDGASDTFSLDFLDNNNNIIKKSVGPISIVGQRTISTNVKGVHTVRANLSKDDSSAVIDVGILFVDCDKAELGS